MVRVRGAFCRERQALQSFCRRRGRQPEGLWPALTRATPPSGEWFHRVECVETESGKEFFFTLRPSPPRTLTAVVWASPDDPRTTPRVKGPDLVRLGELREHAQKLGADEAVALSDGVVAEGAYSTVLAWKEDMGQVWTMEAPRIPSITEEVVLEICRGKGLEVQRLAVTPKDLEGAEVWVVSALHGLRHVTRWINGPALAPATVLHTELQEAWWMRAQDLRA
jgi:Branched-chain amino acid aminotransferase/4-amino-4-deoxychorismate lyase